MKRLYTLLSVLIIAISAQAQHSRVVGADNIIKQADIILRHVNVISMVDSAVLENQIVVVTNNYISYISTDDAKKKLNTNAKIVDATDKYIMPGLAEMHAHLHQPNEIKRYFTLNLLAGVTTIRSMRGSSEHLAYRNITDYTVPNLYLSAPVITSKNNLSATQADSTVKAIYNAKYDFIKLLSIKDETSFDNLMAAAKKYGMKVCGHNPKGVSLEHVLNSGFVSIAHLGGYYEPYTNGDEALKKALLLTKKNNVYQDITLDWYNVVYHQIPVEQMLQRAGMEYIPDSVKQQWVQRRAKRIAQVKDSVYQAFLQSAADMAVYRTNLIRQMQAEGIGLLIGSEGGGDFMVAGYNMIEEMKALQQSGLSNYEVLKCATINAAKMMQQDNKWGTLQVGKQANLILLPTNPLTKLDAITHVEAVLLNNQLHTKDMLLKQLN